jgi:hypothetical protein
MGKPFLSIGVYCLVIKGILGVIYAPHKTFKKIAERPKYLAAAIIILIFIALQTVYYHNYYSKINYEQTLPPVGQLSAFTTTNATQWITTQGITVVENSQDYINQTFYGNNSLQFIGSESSRSIASDSISIALEQFGYTADCGPNGFTSLNMHVKQISPNAKPVSGIVTLYTANSTSDYFSLNITHMLSNSHGSWNNLIIPVGTSEWQSTGTPDWSEVTGLKLTTKYTPSSEVNILLQGIFFRGQYLTQTNALGVGTFFGVAIYSIFIQAVLQWIILTIIAYILLKMLKSNNVNWKPLFVAVGYTLMAIVIIAILLILNSLTLPTIHCPYDLPYSILTYPEAIINSASPASQATYESIMTATANFTRTTTVINIISYVLQGIFITFAVKAVSGCTYTKTVIQAEDTKTGPINEQAPSELSYVKSVVIAVITVVATSLLLSLLAGLGVF